tara:strand:- start:475 stop:738 length:264 start_codon:yes stop_codon:yes gene_type:complete
MPTCSTLDSYGHYSLSNWNPHIHYEGTKELRVLFLIVFYLLSYGSTISICKNFSIYGDCEIGSSISGLVNRFSINISILKALSKSNN